MFCAPVLYRIVMLAWSRRGSAEREEMEMSYSATRAAELDSCRSARMSKLARKESQRNRREAEAHEITLELHTWRALIVALSLPA